MNTALHQRLHSIIFHTILLTMKIHVDYRKLEIVGGFISSFWAFVSTLLYNSPNHVPLTFLGLESLHSFSNEICL